MRIAVLGCGPAGLMATAAAFTTDPDADIVILSNKRKSNLYGAQYLHAPIPGYTDDDDYVLVEYRLRGELDDYRRKVYGPMWDGTVSPEDLSISHAAWDIRETYDRLWEDYEQIIEPINIDPAGLRWIIDGRSSLLPKFDLTISSIYTPSICTEGHKFAATTIRAAGDAPELGIHIPYTRCGDNTVVCNGNDHPSWYRLSNIFGHRTVEWPSDIVPPISHAEVRKPLKNNCDCWPELLKVGRYGRWEKGVLTHHAYRDVKQYIEAVYKLEAKT